MDISSIPSNQVADLLSQLLSDQDPASVGLRRIIRKKSAEQFDFPLRTPVSEEFDVPGKTKKVLSEDERRIIELEQMNRKLKDEVKRIDISARESLQKAYTQGFEEGRKKGYEQGVAGTAADFDKKTAALQEQTATFLASFEEDKNKLYADADRTLAALCLQIVRKILTVEPATRHDVVQNVLKKALSYISDRERITIRVSPDDFDAVDAGRDFWAPVNDRLTNISIEKDPRIERGGCMVESGSGMVDARIGVQLDSITELIETALNGGTPLHRSTSPD